MHVLLVEDDEALAAGIIRGLRDEGFVVNAVATGALALAAVRSDPPDLMVLDLGLPDMDGMEVLSTLRKTQASLPVLLLTARDSMEDKIRGLDKGADDYVVKPFEMPELCARLRVIERRLGTPVASSIIEVGDVTLDSASLAVTCRGSVVELPRREYMLLKALLESAGRVLTREVLETRLYSWGEEVSSNALEVHVHQVRKKLYPELIKTVRGVGYTVGKM
ncbi:MAG: DNA-binding response OmpR family regulator [Halieaceae bacterium]|jgi:DNA-binding response OmpR family regulator